MAEELADLTAALRQRVFRIPATKPSVQSRALALAPEEILRQRHRVLRSLVVERPSVVSRLALAELEVEELRRQLPSVSELLEEHGTWRGSTTLSVLDLFDEDRSITFFTLQHNDLRLEVYSDGILPTTNGDVLAISGHRIGNQVAADSGLVIEQARPYGCATTGEQGILVVPIDYPLDNPEGRGSLEDLRKAFVGADDSLGAYWREVSYGKTWVTARILNPYVTEGRCDRASAIFKRGD